MQIKPKKGILLVSKHKQTALKMDMAVEESDEDRRLITGTVLDADGVSYHKGETVIFGRYALYQLTIQGQDFYLLSEEDVVGKCSYKE